MRPTASVGNHLPHHGCVASAACHRELEHACHSCCLLGRRRHTRSRGGIIDPVFGVCGDSRHTIHSEFSASSGIKLASLTYFRKGATWRPPISPICRGFLMSTVTREQRLARRISALFSTDQQFAAARPSETVAQAIEAPELRVPQIVQTVIDGYADRPALGQRAVEFVPDPLAGRSSAELLPHLHTITYRELSDRVNAVAAALTQDAVQPGDRVAVLGFTSIDYTTVDMALLRTGAISVPLQTSAPVTQLRPIAAETEPVPLASSLDFLDDAAELALTGHLPERLVVFDYHGEVDGHRDALEAATTRLAGTPGGVE